MDKYREEKVKKFEEFIDRRLKPDLVKAIAERLDNSFLHNDDTSMIHSQKGGKTVMQEKYLGKDPSIQ